MPDPRPLTGNEFDTRRGQDISEAERQRRIDYENYLKNFLGEDRNRLYDFLDPNLRTGTSRTDSLFNLADSPLDVEGAAGYSDKGRAALNAQAIDSVPGKYDELISQLKTALSRRGGLTGQTGASGMFGSLLAKILQDKEKTKTGLLRQNIVDEEALKERQLLANRGFALDQRGQRIAGMGNAIGAGNNMANTAISAYDPSRYIGAIGNTMSAPNFPIRPAEPKGRGFWGTLGSAALGTLGALNPFSGFGRGAAGPPPVGGDGGYG